MKVRTWMFGLMMGAAAVGGSSLANAGMKWAYPLTINTSTRWAEGSLGTIRNSANPSEYMSCYISSSGISCAANDGNNNLSCYHAKTRSNYSVMLATVQALDGDSLLQFKANSDGSCGEIIVNDGSYWEPKVR